MERIVRAVSGAQGHGFSLAYGGVPRSIVLLGIGSGGVTCYGSLGPQGLAIELVGARGLGQIGRCTARLSGVNRGGSAGLGP